MRIDINEQLYFDEVVDADRRALVEYLREPLIHERTLRIPYPYTDDDAVAFLERVRQLTDQVGQPVVFAIRQPEGRLLGLCGLEDLEQAGCYRTEIGYWVGRPHWGRGIATAAVRRLCAHAFEQFGVAKIVAHVFTTNPASARVLEKCGFQREGLLRRHFQKRDQLIDVWAYGLLP